MIKIEKIKEDYYRCASCYKNKREDSSDILMVSIGFDERQTASVKLCKDCIFGMNERAKEI